MFIAGCQLPYKTSWSSRPRCSPQCAGTRCWIDKVFTASPYYFISNLLGHIRVYCKCTTNRVIFIRGSIDKCLTVCTEILVTQHSTVWQIFKFMTVWHGPEDLITITITVWQTACHTDHVTDSVSLWQLDRQCVTLTLRQTVSKSDSVTNSLHTL